MSEVKTHKRGDKRADAAKIMKSHWDASGKEHSMDDCLAEIAGSIGVNVGNAKSYYKFIAKGMDAKYTIAGFVEGTTVKKPRAAKETAAEVIEKTTAEVKKGGSAETLRKIAGIAKSKRNPAAATKVIEAMASVPPAGLQHAHSEPDVTESAPVEEKIAA
jgi:hypothetical protein